jgi:hypothetical protein
MYNKTMELTQLQSIGDEELYDFLNNAPKYFRDGERIKKFQLKNGDYIHCVLWNYHFYITGTDIVKILVWRFQNSGKQLGNMKKFEEGIFSDLRNLKPGIDASLEGPRSEFLEFLYKNGCIRTQKKQKVFYWYSVPHDALFCDALERDMRRDSSIYNYNGYPTERRSQYSETTTGHKYQQHPKISHQIFNSTFEHPRRTEIPSDIKKDLFNIKSTLFGDIKPINTQMNSCSNGTPVQMINNNICKGICESQGDFLFDKIFSSNSEQKISQYEDFEDESKIKQIKTKINADLRKKFDDFDLDQLGFLKERCQEYGLGSIQHEKKKLSENLQVDDNGLGVSAKVRFVGMDGGEIGE